MIGVVILIRQIKVERDGRIRRRVQANGKREVGPPSAGVAGPAVVRLERKVRIGIEADVRAVRRDDTCQSPDVRRAVISKHEATDTGSLARAEDTIAVAVVRDDELIKAKCLVAE